MDQCKSNLKCMCVVCDCVQYFFGVCPKTQAQYSFSFCLNFNNRIEHSVLKPLILSNILSALQNHLQNIFLETVIWVEKCGRKFAIPLKQSKTAKGKKVNALKPQTHIDYTHTPRISEKSCGITSKWGQTNGAHAGFQLRSFLLLLKFSDLDSEIGEQSENEAHTGFNKPQFTSDFSLVSLNSTKMKRNQMDLWTIASL